MRPPILLGTCLIVSEVVMDVVQEFQKHANECRRMSRFSSDRESKAMWNRMAERWLALMIKEKERIAQHAEAQAIVRTRLVRAKRSQAA
jgi:hypothetical protein